MNYCALFSLNDGAIQRHICFQPFYRYVNLYKSIKIYSVDEWGNYGYNKSTLSTEQLSQYLTSLQNIGFKFSFTRVKDLKISCFQKLKDGWEFEIIPQENGDLATLVLLNALRYTYETKYTIIVRTYLDLINVKTRIKFSDFNKFLLSHYILSQPASGHTISYDDNKPFIYYDEKLIKTQLFNKIDRCTNTTRLGYCKRSSAKMKKDIRQFLEQKNYEQLFQYWKEFDNIKYL